MKRMSHRAAFGPDPSSNTVFHFNINSTSVFATKKKSNKVSSSFTIQCIQIATNLVLFFFRYIFLLLFFVVQFRFILLQFCSWLVCRIAPCCFDIILLCIVIVSARVCVCLYLCNDSEFGYLVTFLERNYTTEY